MTGVQVIHHMPEIKVDSLGPVLKNTSSEIFLRNPSLYATSLSQYYTNKSKSRSSNHEAEIVILLNLLSALLDQNQILTGS